MLIPLPQPSHQPALVQHKACPGDKVVQKHLWRGIEPESARAQRALPSVDGVPGLALEWQLGRAEAHKIEEVHIRQLGETRHAAHKLGQITRRDGGRQLHAPQLTLAVAPGRPREPRVLVELPDELTQRGDQQQVREFADGVGADQFEARERA